MPRTPNRQPLIAAGDLWVVLAIVLVLFFPFGLGGGVGAPAPPSVPADALPFRNSSGAMIGVSPNWSASAEPDQQGWTTTGIGDGDVISVRLLSLPAPIGSGETLATFARDFVEGDARSSGAVDLQIVESGEVEMASGLSGYRTLSTDRAADGTRRATLTVVSVRDSSVALVMMRGPRESMSAAVIERNEPYLRSLTPLGVIDTTQPPDTGGIELR